MGWGRGRVGGEGAGRGWGGGRAKLAWRSGGGKSRGTQDGVHKPQLFKKTEPKRFRIVESVFNGESMAGGWGLGVEGCRGGWGGGKVGGGVVVVGETQIEVHKSVHKPQLLRKTEPERIRTVESVWL